MNLRVSDLIRDDGKWKVDTLHELFPPNEVHRIQQILIGNVREVWAFNKAGDYSVKSGCCLISKLAENIEGGGAHDPAVVELKRQIWKVPTIPKIRTFL